MTPRLRKLALTAHVAASVGWLGAVAAFLVLAVAGLTGRSAPSVRGAYLAMELTGWYVIVPLSVASLLTGLIQSLGTPWGLFRHYWIVVKLLINLLATALLLVHMEPTGRLAAAAAERTLSETDLRGLRVQLVADAGAALLVLLVATALSIYKPRGLTPYGRRRVSPYDEGHGTPGWMYAFGTVVFVMAALFAVLHITGRGLGGH